MIKLLIFLALALHFISAESVHIKPIEKYKLQDDLDQLSAQGKARVLVYALSFSNNKRAFDCKYRITNLKTGQFDSGNINSNETISANEKSLNNDVHSKFREFIKTKIGERSFAHIYTKFIDIEPGIFEVEFYSTHENDKYDTGAQRSATYKLEAGDVAILETVWDRKRSKSSKENLIEAYRQIFSYHMGNYFLLRPELRDMLKESEHLLVKLEDDFTRPFNRSKLVNYSSIFLQSKRTVNPLQQNSIEYSGNEALDSQLDAYQYYMGKGYSPYRQRDKYLLFKQSDFKPGQCFDIYFKYHPIQETETEYIVETKTKIDKVKNKLCLPNKKTLNSACFYFKNNEKNEVRLADWKCLEPLNR